MITKIEEISDREEFGIDLIKFQVYLKKPDGTEVSEPLTVYMWEIRKFINIYAPTAAAYVNKVSESLRCEGIKDGKILKVLHEDGFPIYSYVERYVKSIPQEKISKHITWAENRETVSSENYAKKPDNSREFSIPSSGQKFAYLPKLWMRWYGKK